MIKNKVLIRNINTNDYDKLRDIYYKIRTEEFPWSNHISLSDFDDSTQDEVIFTVLIDDKIVGFVSVWVEDKFIHNLFVSKEYRKYGVGKALINQVLLTFGTPLTLKCIKENYNAVNFYLSNGWKIEKEDICVEGAYYLMSYNKRCNEN